MGVLKVKVGADWLPVSQGFDMTPAGFIGQASPSADQTGITQTPTDVNNMSVTWNADPTHTYKTSVFATFAMTAGTPPATVYLMIMNQSGALVRRAASAAPALQSIAFGAFAVESGLSGVQTRKVQTYISAGTMNVSGAAFPGLILVEDITTVVPMSVAVQTAWQNATLINGWANFDVNTYGPAQYRRIGDRVELRGLIMSGTIGQAAFILPVGYRPPKFHYAATVSNSLYGYMRLQPTGEVVPTSGSNAWFALDNCAFSVTQY